LACQARLSSVALVERSIQHARPCSVDGRRRGRMFETWLATVQ
jgi:hypothetical protein